MVIKKRALQCTLLIMLLSNISFAQISPAKLSAEDIKDDLRYLYHSLQASHYNLYAFQNKHSYDSLFNQLQSHVTTDSLTQLATISLYQQLVSFANTGHCEIDYPAQPYREYAFSGGTVFPLELAFEQGKVYIRKSFSSNTQVSTGDELLSIDNVSIDAIQKQLAPFISAERDYFKKAKMEFWSFPRLFFQLNGKKDSWTIQTKNKRNKLVQSNIQAIPVLEYERGRHGEIVNPKKSLRFYGNIAYLNAGPFGSNEADGETVFKQFIDSVFTVIREQKTEQLIIDLRNNPGGHNAYSDYLVAYFAHKPFQWSSQFSVKTSKLLKTQVSGQADTTDAFSKKILSYRDGQTFSYKFPSYLPVEKTKRYRGKIFVLVNRQTYSMAAVTAALIQDYKFGIIVGEETGDMPSLYASQFSFILPRTGITVKVPKGYITRVNGSKKSAGVQPIIYIRDHLLDDTDEILEGLLKKLKAPKQ